MVNNQKSSFQSRVTTELDYFNTCFSGNNEMHKTKVMRVIKNKFNWIPLDIETFYKAYTIIHCAARLRVVLFPVLETRGF